jgi:UDP-glucose 4-epimerase
MKILVTGSAGHLGEALIRTLQQSGYETIGIDIKASRFTAQVGSITDCTFVKQNMEGVQAVYHTATLHKPHVVTHNMQQFVDTNITGTLNLLQEAVKAGVKSFVFTSTTSVFGDALVPPIGMPAAWITEDVRPVPKNIYGVTKFAAENLCQLFYRNYGLPCIILRTSRFFPEEDDRREVRESYAGENLKVNEFLFRRVDIEDVVSAHLLAADRVGKLGFGTYIISATSPFLPIHLSALRNDAPSVIKELFPGFEIEYQRNNWRMFTEIDRVYVNELARLNLGWVPKYDFHYILKCLNAGTKWQSELTSLIGEKGYHEKSFSGEPYPVS